MNRGRVISVVIILVIVFFSLGYFSNYIGSFF